MNRWEHRIHITLHRDTTATETAGLIATELELLPKAFRGLVYDGESLDDIARYLREDENRGSTFAEVNGMIGRLYDWADEHRLWINIHRSSEPREVWHVQCLLDPLAAEWAADREGMDERRRQALLDAVAEHGVGELDVDERTKLELAEEAGIATGMPAGLDA